MAVIQSVVAGAVATMFMMKRQHDVTAEAGVILELSDNLRLLKTYSGYDVDAQLVESLVELKKVPVAIAVKAGSVLQHQWGGRVRITQQAGGGGFAITYEDVPKEACALLVSTVVPGHLVSVGKGIAASHTTSSDFVIAKITANDIGKVCDQKVSDVHWSTLAP